ncbi:MAG: hypothetical protein HYS22_01365 [Deltaproteobacteria bacterium]|nr:hypothetical protein [Deltaproteobacteria bacterium]
MTGFITERNWKEIEESFPELHRFYLSLPHKPNTFLELMNLYDNQSKKGRRFMKTSRILITLVLGLSLAHCSSNPTSEEETNTTANNIDASTVALRVETAGSALLPNINSSGSASSGLSALTTGTSDDWTTYTNTDNVYVLTDIFGDPNQYPRVVTKIRVLLGHLRGKLEEVFSKDKNVDCTGASPLTAGDLIPIAFYGTIDNGTADNRYFDCVITTKGDSPLGEVPNSQETTIYGKDNSGVVRIANMSDTTSANTEQAETRGSLVRIRIVRVATYAEVKEGENTIGSLDLNFAHGSSYSGLDENFGTGDDIIFKSRSRLTGRVTMDSSGTAIGGVGDFTVTKFDSDASASPAVTKVLGRGDYQNGYSLLKINSNRQELSNIPATFCTQRTDNSEIPTPVDQTNCTGLESSLAWGENPFPFTISPALDNSFEDKLFFEGNDTDLIDNAGNNFVIPAY